MILIPILNKIINDIDSHSQYGLAHNKAPSPNRLEALIYIKLFISSMYLFYQ